MALRFRSDVQKASYYVWFLGAEEARGFRDAKVITAALPYLIERSTYQEPHKITLQVSHKGIKIIQGPTKHFIPHSAITCSIRVGDIAACILLLYNPDTKCPLHVHAYRCDSQTTAEALHQQLEVLINRPENQKQFEELESRIGVTEMMWPHVPDQKHFQLHKMTSSLKKSESSLKSESTRDTECTANFSAQLTNSHNYKQKRNLFDSLAAELRAKLNGFGPPLLLPPRDYDTVHRAKGNLFRSKFSSNEKNLKNQSFVQSSKNVFSEQIRSFENLRLNQSSDEENLSSKETGNLNALIQTRKLKNRKDLPFEVYQKSNNVNNNNANSLDKYLKEDEIRPNIVQSIHFNKNLKNNLCQKKNEIENYSVNLNKDFSQFSDPSYLRKTKKINYIDQTYPSNPEIILKSKNITNSSDNQFDIQKKLNLTDKQKYIQMYNKNRVHEKNQPIIYDTEKQKNGLREYYLPSNCSKYRSCIPFQNDEYQQEYEDNSYRHSTNINYEHKIQGIKPVIRQNSFESDNEFKRREINQFLKKSPTINSSNKDSELSARDRFYGAKEKFRLIEHLASTNINNISNNINKCLLQSPIQLETRDMYTKFYCGKCNEHEFDKQTHIIKNANCFSNLNKSYRHSFAEISQPRISRDKEEYKQQLC